MSEKRKSFNNPMLMGALELLKAENTPDHRSMVMQEILRARFLCPVIVDPPLVANEEGVARAGADSQVNMLLLTANDDKKYFMGYTDMEEVNKWTSQPKHQMIAFKFSDYVHMLLKPDCTVNGIVINPFDHNLVITKDMVLAMLKKGDYPEQE